MKINGKRPNILIIMTDEERYPPSYENPEAKAYRESLPGRAALRQNALECHRHYTGSAACAPARATFYTGQYPSLHGVSQTPGMAKSSFDPNLYWLDPDTVPTLGHYFRHGGYRTFYKGKWHASDADLIIPGSTTPVLSNNDEGVPYPEIIDLYRNADRLDPFGFTGWIGPEPHGAAQANDGMNRDPLTADEAVSLLEQLDQSENDDPFLMVCSFVNPHDIVLYGAPYFDEFQAMYDACKANPSQCQLPKVDPPPTFREHLATKPRCQQDWVYQYSRGFIPQPQTEEYFQFYYYLMSVVDAHIKKVYDKLTQCRFFQETIVVFTADHGEMLGAHGGMHQKWFTAYEEIVRVPCLFSNPELFAQTKHSTRLTSHLDIMPTLLGLADIDAAKICDELSKSHSEAHPLVGRDLSAWIENRANDGGEEKLGEESLYFMTDDEVLSGLNQTNFNGEPYRSVIQPKHVESVITRKHNAEGELQLWKYSRTFDNPRFHLIDQDPTKVTEAPVPAEFECYNLDKDPTEEHNLASPVVSDQADESLLKDLHAELEAQRKAKRLRPQTLNRHPSNRTYLRD